MAITKEQIIDLINKKIAGQGSAVDVGGALPQILSGLADMGISSDMTVAEQMQARKDLGLYYEAQEPGEKRVIWTGEAQSVTLPGWAKISDDTPARDDIISFAGETGNYLIFTNQTDGYVVTADDVAPGMEMRIVLDDSDGHEPGIYYSWLGREFSPALVYAVLVDTVHKVPAKFLPEQSGSDPDAVHFTQQSLTDAQKNQARKNLGLYYEGTERGEKEARYQNQSESLTLPGFAKISDDIPGKDDIIAVGYDGDDFSNFVTEDSIDGGFSISLDSDVFFIVINSELAGSSPGIYLNYDLMAENVSLKYYGDIDIVSKIPERFLPDGGGPINLTGLPTASMTTQAELDDIGLTTSAVEKIVNGEATALLHRITMPIVRTDRLVVGYCRMSAPTAYTVTFSDDSNRYEVVAGTGGITVTVTPLS